MKAWNSALIEFELAARVKRSSGWRLIMARNRWFQRKVVSALSAHQPSTLDPQPVLFSYSYTALEPFRFAKARGWKTVLGQIDPGPPEEASCAGFLRRTPGNRERGSQLQMFIGKTGGKNASWPTGLW